MTHDPELVEALADEIVGQVWAWAHHAGADVTIEDTRRVLAFHRLVQLPEEPSGWVSPENGAFLHNSDDVEIVVIERHPCGNLPVYIIPGPPEEVEP